MSDGKSHLLDFKVNGTAMGEGASEVKLAQAGKVHVTANVAALLQETPDEAVRQRSYEQKPYWDLERARIGNSRTVPLELIVNGVAVAKTDIVADGTQRAVAFDTNIDRSSWVALRILPSSHTNPVFVMVDNKPIRASRKSAEWCLKAVDQCWKQKSPQIRDSERIEAEQVYELARRAYRERLAETR